MRQTRNLVVVGHGAAGLAAALAAAETARLANVDLAVALLEKAPEDEAGGNTRWSPSYIRMASTERVTANFAEDLFAETNGKGDTKYFRALAANATATIAWLQSHGIAFHKPIYYLSAGPPRIQPIGGGEILVRELTRAAHDVGVQFRYGCAADDLLVQDGRISGVAAKASGVAAKTLPADAVILACGGFEANKQMMRFHFGPKSETMPIISPGTHFNTGDGIRMAEGQGAALSGDFQGMHAEPIDPRSKKSAPVVLVYPYGIVVDKNGRRFFDEGGGLVHETWETFARKIQFESEGGQVFAILDGKLRRIAGYERAIRSDVPPYQADSLNLLAGKIGIEPRNLSQTVAQYNAAASGDPMLFDATKCDGLATAGLKPPKSNWARKLDEPPFIAFPIVGAVAYTFGGVATNERAQVLKDDRAIPGLYAAGEITGHFYGLAPNSISILRALVFGRIAGQEAVSYMRSTS